MTTGRVTSALRLSPAFPTLRTVALAGAAIFVVGLFADHRRAWTGYLLGFALFATLALAGAFFVAVVHVARARWASPLRHIPAAMAAAIPFAAILGLGLIAGTTSLYPWAHGGDAHEHGVEHKLWYLNPLAFATRLILCFAVWIGLSSQLVRSSRAAEVDVRAKGLAYRYGIGFIAAFGVTFSLASWDWFLSLEPAWFSTIHALQTLAGLATAGLGLVMITAALAHERRDPRRPIPLDALDDLGKLGIALSLFWAYIGFCQSMLIWYTNMPEETGWYLARREGGFGALGAVSFVLCGLVPFCVLMPRRSRRSPAVILRIGVVFLVGRLVELWYLLGPPLMPDGPRFGVFELGPVIGAAALFFWIFRNALGHGQDEHPA